MRARPLARSRSGARRRCACAPGLVLAVALTVALAGCRAGLDAYADTPENARVAADQLLASLHFRFTNPERDSRYEAGRLRIARYALSPRSLRDDTVWTVRGDSTAALLGHGRLQDRRRYLFTAEPAVAPPRAVGESRHETRLTTLPDGDFTWTTRVDQALGTVAPQAIGHVLTALLAAAERPADAIRADYRTTYPTAAAFGGRLFRLDSLATRGDANGATSVRLRVVIRPDSIAADFPAFARYLEKYVSPARYEIALRDPVLEGASPADTWFLAEAADDTLTLSWRSRGGALLPLTGPPRQRPDTLRLDVTAFAKFGLFTVGVSDLRGEFTFVSAPGEAGWRMRFRDVPTWHLPPIVGRLLRAPLRRPFEGEGTAFVLTARRGAGGPTLLHRRLRFDVRESAIMRWLGKLGFTALDDFAGEAERDEARWLASLLRAMRADTRAAFTGGPVSSPTNQ